jgi:hypothetical protein
MPSARRDRCHDPDHAFGECPLLSERETPDYWPILKDAS